MTATTFQLRHTYEAYGFRFLLFLLLAVFFSIFSHRYNQIAPAVVGLCALSYFLLKTYFYDSRYSVGSVRRSCSKPSALRKPVIAADAISMTWVACYILAEQSHSVWLGDAAVHMHPAHLWYSPTFITSIRYADITAVTRETNDLQALLAAARPSRRITIYADKVSPPNVIDVSLKHFAPADIRLLLQRLREVRPDLSLPTI